MQLQFSPLCKLRVIDVGGGSRPNDADGISNISLRWMIREVVAAGHHDLFSAEPGSCNSMVQNRFSRITIPEQMGAGVQENYFDPLDIEDLKKDMKR
jgi:hypothetical protein